MASRSRKVCCRLLRGTLAAVCVWIAILWPGFKLGMKSIFPSPVGDRIRRQLHPEIMKALASSDWTAVASGYDARNSALLIGDARGVQWSAEHGWISLKSMYSVASESKLITTLTVYRLMARSGGKLTPQSLVADFLDDWPRSPALGGNVTLADVMSFSEGFKTKDLDRLGCLRGEASWTECLRGIAATPFVDPPGVTFNYNSYHLIVAAAVALMAVGRPLTDDAWIQAVYEEVYKPSGIDELPVYARLNVDAPPFTPKLGSWFFHYVVAFPDFSGGLRMSAEQYQKVLHTLQFGGLLDPTALSELTRDHTSSVKHWGGLAGPWLLNMGTWHYAQGCWLTCDAASDMVDNHSLRVWPAERKFCEGKTEPLPRVVHSVGIWGFYAWMDFTHGYYGVFAQSLIVNVARVTIATLTAASIAALITCYLCGTCGGSAEVADMDTSCGGEEGNDESDSDSDASSDADARAPISR